ncbi:MAG: tRNA (adenosine(37)-N6)-threonylcarbamoyltransferase complex dimerization subunit type 1 TsaB [Phascolarctobacterium faecium]
MGMTHSEGLMPQLEQLLTRTKITKNEIDLLAVSMGPGSFTGLRIGLASAEAMAYSWHKPICGVNTLKALAYNLPIDGCIITCFRRTKGNFIRRFMNGSRDTHRASGQS